MGGEREWEEKREMEMERDRKRQWEKQREKERERARAREGDCELKTSPKHLDPGVPHSLPTMSQYIPPSLNQL